MRIFAQRSSEVLGGDCASMRIFAQRSSGVLGGLCFYENFRTEKQRGFGGIVIVLL